MLSNVPDYLSMDHNQIHSYRQKLNNSIVEDELQLSKLLPLIQSLQKSYDDVEKALRQKKSILSNLIMYETMEEYTINLIDEDNNDSQDKTSVKSDNTTQSLFSVSPPTNFHSDISFSEAFGSKRIENNNNYFFNSNTSTSNSISPQSSNDTVYVATITLKIAEDCLRNAGGKLIGVNGTNIKKIRRDCACCIHLRGRGSTKLSELKDIHNRNRASVSKAFEPLHVIIQSVHSDKDIAVTNVRKAIDRVVLSLDRGLKDVDSSRHEITNFEIKETKKRYNKKTSLYS
uniref:KH domain-containing protein n=1 Tax=Parastrongyloides trichosuri TaxID=131310 RepID=A0A0N4ZVZ2_PARTI